MVTTLVHHKHRAAGIVAPGLEDGTKVFFFQRCERLFFNVSLIPPGSNARSLRAENLADFDAKWQNFLIYLLSRHWESEVPNSSTSLYFTSKLFFHKIPDFTSNFFPSKSAVFRLSFQLRLRTYTFQIVASWIRCGDCARANRVWSSRVAYNHPLLHSVYGRALYFLNINHQPSETKWRWLALSTSPHSPHTFLLLRIKMRGAKIQKVAKGGAFSCCCFSNSHDVRS